MVSVEKKNEENMFHYQIRDMKDSRPMKKPSNETTDIKPYEGQFVEALNNEGKWCR